MPFDPTKPAANSQLSSGEMRDQLNALNSDKASHADVADAINGTSANSNGVGTLDIAYGDPDAEELRNKVNELLNALRR